MNRKTIFVIAQIASLLFVAVVIFFIAISSAGSSPTNQTDQVDSEIDVIVLESNTPTPSATPTPEQGAEEESKSDGKSGNPNVGRTNEDSPLYQQCMAEFNAIRSHEQYLRSRISQLEAEYGNLISRIQQTNDPAEVETLTIAAQSINQQTQDIYSELANFQSQNPNTWSCGINGKFYF